MAESWRRDALRWLKWWLLLGLVGGAVSPVVGPLADRYYWHIKLVQIEFSIPLAIVGWLVFVAFQQGWNKRRLKWIFWCNAFAAWTLVKLGAMLSLS